MVSENRLPGKSNERETAYFEQWAIYMGYGPCVRSRWLDIGKVRLRLGP